MVVFSLYIKKDTTSKILLQILTLFVGAERNSFIFATDVLF